jgi:hypothetical protein
MTFLPYPPTTTTDVIAVLKQDAGIAHEIIHGNVTADVYTESGLVPSFAKVVKTLTDEVNAATGVDTTLRADLAAENSTVMIAGITAVQVKKSADVADVMKKSNARSLGPTMIDLHYGVLRGRGWASGEVDHYDLNPHTVATSAAAGQKNIVIASNIGSSPYPLIVNQLITYRASNGQFYSATIHSISGTAPATLTLKSNVEHPIAAGGNVYPFYANISHPNKFGYSAIADYALRNSKTAYEVVDLLTLAKSGAAVTTLNTSNNYDNCGSENVTAYDVTLPSVGVDSLYVTCNIKKTGAYTARFFVNPKGASITFFWESAGLSSSVVADGNEPTMVELPFVMRGGSDTISFTVYSTAAGAQFNIKPTVQICAPVAASPSLNQGKHLLLGDSWFAQVGLSQRLTEALPQAEIVNVGVGGQNATDLLSRFDTDVAAANPDVVWIMVGTNDYYQSVSNDLFNLRINQLVSKCAEIGTHMIVFNTSVGNVNAVPDLLNRSRGLADNTRYEKSPASAERKTTIVNISAIVPAGASEYQLINFGSRVSPIEIKSYWISGLDLKIGTKTALSSAHEVSHTLTAGGIVNTAVSLSWSSNRYVDIRCTNSGGSSVTLYGYIEMYL